MGYGGARGVEAGVAPAKKPDRSGAWCINKYQHITRLLILVPAALAALAAPPACAPQEEFQLGQSAGDGRKIFGDCNDASKIHPPLVKLVRCGDGCPADHPQTGGAHALSVQGYLIYRGKQRKKTGRIRLLRFLNSVKES